jgi:hypothetical protein
LPSQAWRLGCLTWLSPLTSPPRFEERLPGLDGKPGNESTCLYTSTANEDFILIGTARS